MLELWSRNAEEDPLWKPDKLKYCVNSLRGWFTIPCLFYSLNIFILKKKNCGWPLSYINISIIGLVWVSQLMCFHQSGPIYLKTVFISRICCYDLVLAHFVCFLLVCAWQEFLPCRADSLTLVPGAHVLSPVGPLGFSTKTLWQKNVWEWQPEHWQLGLCSSYGSDVEKAVYFL